MFPPLGTKFMGVARQAIISLKIRRCVKLKNMKFALYASSSSFKETSAIIPQKSLEFFIRCPFFLSLSKALLKIIEEICLNELAPNDKPGDNDH